MALPLQNRTCLITGGASGLGKAIAQAFLTKGAEVLVADIDADLLLSLSTEHSKQALDQISAEPEVSSDPEISNTSGTLHTAICDVSSEASVAELFQTALARFGRPLDVLVNNAGVADLFEAAGETEMQTWQRVLDVNLTGPFLCTRAAVRAFLAREDAVVGEVTGRGGGCVINVGSIAATRGATAGAAYTNSKHGLLGLTRNTAAAYGGKGIRCNIILPGGMETNIMPPEMYPRLDQEGFGRMQRAMNAGGAQLVDVAKVAELCIYLASDAASILNGSAIAADGGWSAW